MQPGINKTLLPNGVRVVSEKMPYVKSVAVGIWVKTGSRNEQIELNGISHFIEHIVFKGTEKRNTYQIAESLETVGGILNAFTGREYTCFYAHILDEDLDLAVDVLSDIVCNPVISSDDVEKEKQIVLEEINSLEDVPDELVFEYFQDNVFAGHPLAYSVLGTKDSIKSLKSENIKDYHSRYYVNNNVVIAASGNVEHEELVKLVEKYFCLSEGTEVFYENSLPESKPLKQVYKREVNQAHICIGNKALSYKADEKYALILLHSLLGGGMSSKLFQLLREKYGIAYSVFSFIDFYSDSGTFGVYCGVEKSNIDKSISIITEEFYKTAEEKIDSAELIRLKSQLKGNLMLGLESTQSRMNRLAKMELYLENYISLDEVISKIEHSTADEIQNLAQKILSGKMYSSIITL